MDPARYRRLRALVHGAAGQPEAGRRAWLEQAAPGEAALVEEALQLLARPAADTDALLPAPARAPTGAGARLSLAPGTRLGPYTLGRELGRGGMGVVHEAQGPEPRPPLAVKVILPHLLLDPASRQRFVREAQLGLELADPNVVRTLDVGEAEVAGAPLLYLVLERVQGRTLRALLEAQGPLPEALVREVGRQAAAGLSALHARGIVHRDLKPENLILTGEGRVKVMDLGVAKVSGSAAALTQEGLFVGSPAYASPEQWAGSEVGPASDLYSLGAVLYELLAGRPPFDAHDPVALLRAHAEEAPPPLTACRPSVSAFLEALVLRLLAKAPDERFVSARALAQALEEGESGAWWTGQAAHARPPAPPRAARAAVPLVGRDAELALLLREAEAARLGQGGVVLVEGEAGAGKTRLVSELAGRLAGEAGRPTTLLRSASGARGAEDGLAEALVEHLGPGGLPDALAQRLGLAPPVAQALAAHLTRRPPPSGVEPLEPASASALLSRLARRLSAEAPLVWIVEDLHAADPEERRTVGLLARATAEHPLLLVVTARPGLDADTRAALAAAPGFLHLPLPRLPEEQVAALLGAAVRDPALGRRLARLLGERLDGIPLFVLETVQHLLREGRLVRGTDGGLRPGPHLEAAEPPRALLDLVLARLAPLDEAERALLDLAAVEGLEFEPDLLARTLGQERIEVLETLGRLERRHGLVRSGPRRCRFDHTLLHEAVVGALPAGLRAALHDRLARTLSAGAPEGRPEGEALVRVARHRLLGAEPEAARPLAERALAHLASAGRAREQLALAERALATEGALSGAARLDALLAAARLSVNLRRFAPVEGWLAEAERLAEGSGLSRERARVAYERAAQHLRQARYAATLEGVARAQALAAEAGDDALRVSVARLEGRALLLQGRVGEARACFERALALATWASAPQAAANVRAELGILLQEQGLLAEAEAHQRAAVSLLQAVGHRRDASATLADLGNTLQLAGRMQEALGRYDEAMALAHEVGFLDLQVSVEINTGELCLRCGDLEAARRHLEAAAELAEESGARREEGYAHHGLGLVAWWAGDRAGARRRLEQALALRQAIGNRAGLGETALQLGTLDLEEGRREEARARLERALALARELDDPSLELGARLQQARLEGPETDLDGLRRALRAAWPRLRHDARLEGLVLLARLTGLPEDARAAAAELAAQQAALPARLAATFREQVPYAREAARLGAQAGPPAPRPGGTVPA